MNDLSRRRLFPVAIATVLCGALARLPAGAGEGTRVTARVAISGYDAVAYFTDGHPVKGSAAFSSPFDDAVYYFASAEHQKIFAADPDRYAPHYSGYCAVGISVGFKVEADPEAWAISDGRLFVFQNKQGKAVFSADPAGIIAKADANWPALKEGK
jgi:YHS domain-containing protein